ncbi:hypothetical protein GDO78_016883 [Eleutherodactylus coqui]|uniref:Uncharacterized protein n=1 Tax=Eleutherodactylus coqui TaxID=57060 RepID=A0A8J6BLZ7_ELECQ|nr:hypothetical protein GDO78_016883 [Eleutherodactylus coqui]
MELTCSKDFHEACFPMTIIWERITHAYTSDSPPQAWGLQVGGYGCQSWFINPGEKYVVFWDTFRSYWELKTPFGPVLHFTGPLFLDKSRKGLHIPPSLCVSSTDILTPASSDMVCEQMAKIGRFMKITITEKV